MPTRREASIHPARAAGRFRTGVFAVATMLGSRVIGLASGLVIARLLGASQYGLFSICRDLVATLNIASKSGFDVGLVRWLPSHARTPGQQGWFVKRALAVSALISIALVVGVWAGGGTFLESHVYKHPGFSAVLSLLILVLPFMTAVNILGGAFRGTLAVRRRLVAEMLVQPGLRLILVLLLFLYAVTVWAVVWATVLSFATALVYLLWYGRAWFRQVGRVASDVVAGGFRPFWRYSLLVSLTLSVALLLSKTDILMLGYLGSTADVGSYAVMQLAVPLIALFNGAFGQQLAPTIAACDVEGNREKMREALRTHARWMAMASGPVFLVFVVFGPGLFKIFGHGYRIDPYALGLLAAGQLVTSVFSSTGFLLSMTSAYRREVPVLLLALVANVALNFLWIPRYGLTGAAGATFVALILANALRLYVVRRTHRIVPVGPEILKPLALSLIVMAPMVVVRLLMKDQTFMWATGASILYLALYSIVLVKWGLSKSERRDLSQLLANQFGRSGR